MAHRDAGNKAGGDHLIEEQRDEAISMVYLGDQKDCRALTAGMY